MNIATNDYDKIKKLFNIDELKTKVRSNLGNITDADLATIENKFYYNCSDYLVRWRYHKIFDSSNNESNL